MYTGFVKPALARAPLLTLREAVLASARGSAGFEAGAALEGSDADNAAEAGRLAACLKGSERLVPLKNFSRPLACGVCVEDVVQCRWRGSI